jgi:steroid 5-alpha reductase family enzyme
MLSAADGLHDRAISAHFRAHRSAELGLRPSAVLCISGVFFHYVGDAQKFFVLQLRKGLIEDGLFAKTRNPNYLGEVLIYAGFALAPWHWQPFVVLAGWFVFFVRNMQRKDKSMARHPEFAAYKSRTGMFLPSLGTSSTRSRVAQ